MFSSMFTRPRAACSRLAASWSDWRLLSCSHRLPYTRFGWLGAMGSGMNPAAVVLGAEAGAVVPLEEISVAAFLTLLLPLAVLFAQFDAWCCASGCFTECSTGPGTRGAPFMRPMALAFSHRQQLVAMWGPDYFRPSIEARVAAREAMITAMARTTRTAAAGMSVRASGSIEGTARARTMPAKAQRPQRMRYGPAARWAAFQAASDIMVDGILIPTIGFIGRRPVAERAPPITRMAPRMDRIIARATVSPDIVSSPHINWKNFLTVPVSSPQRPCWIDRE